MVLMKPFPYFMNTHCKYEVPCNQFVVYFAFVGKKYRFYYCAKTNHKPLFTVTKIDTKCYRFYYRAKINPNTYLL